VLRDDDDDDDDDDDERRFYITYWRLGFFGKKAADEIGGDTSSDIYRTLTLIFVEMFGQ
jgi:hypothetical protein